MANEDFDKIKLKPVLEEAYRLIMLLEKRNTDKNSKIEELEKSKQELIDKQLKLKSLTKIEDRLGEIEENDKTDKNHSMDRVGEDEEQRRKERIMFKSIMCPLGDKCPKDNRARWPKSGTKTVTPFGDKCLYAHHYHELEFPETLSTKISAITTM